MTVIPRENPGTYIELSGEQTVRPAASLAATVAIAAVADWGPLGTDGVQSFGDMSEAEQVIGDSASQAHDAILGAFVGPGVPGSPGAGTVKFFRLAAAAAAKATDNIANTAGSPADALKLDAIYKGTRGNRISYITEEDPADATKDRLRILFDGVTVERYTYAPTDVAGLAAQINAKPSRWVTATSLVTGTALAMVTETALSGGNDGSTITGTEWAAAIQGLDFEEFSVFSAHGVTDDTIKTTIKTWADTLEQENRPITVVFGGGGSETLAQAITAADAVASHHVVQVGVGTFHDDYLDRNVTSAELTSRIAGMLAGAGEEISLTGMPIAGVTAVAGGGVGSDELATAWKGGITAFRRTTREDTDLIVNKGVTTFTDPADPNFPYELFSDPRIVRVADLFLRRLKEWGDRYITGPTRVIEPTKAAVRQQGEKEINDLIRRGLILPGEGDIDKPFFQIIDNPGVGLEDAIVFEFGWKFVRTTNFLIGSGKVR